MVSSLANALKGKSAFTNSRGLNLEGVRFTFNTRDMTFDRNILSKNNGKMWKKINETPLKKIGLQIRRRAISSIPKAERAKKVSTQQKPSKPGRPPKSRDRRTLGGHPMRKILSIPVLADTVVVVGSVGLDSRRNPAPGIHEHGETVTIKVPTRKRGRARSKKQREAAAKLFKAGRIQRKKTELETRTAKYPKRPFMVPAMEKMIHKLPSYYRNTLIRM